MMRLWPLITDLIARLIARLIAVNGKIAITPHRTAPRRTAPHLHVTSGRARARARAPHRPSGRPRRAAPRLASATATARPGPARPGPARLGEASERARACGSPSSSYRLHKWCTRSPPFKSVEILLNSRYGIKH